MSCSSRLWSLGTRACTPGETLPVSLKPPAQFFEGCPSRLQHLSLAGRAPCPEDTGSLRSQVPRWTPAPSPPRRKKLSNFLHTQQWKGASNYVAKRYVESVGRDVYFGDVRLQMEAKLWGEEYNRHKPPKQVCVAASVPPAPARAAGGHVRRPGAGAMVSAVAHSDRHLPSVAGSLCKKSFIPQSGAWGLSEVGWDVFIPFYRWGLVVRSLVGK